jgi:hypothetical protein
VLPAGRHIGEFEQYQLNQTEKGRITYSAPSGEHDDVVSAKMLQHWGIVNEGVPDATIIDGVAHVLHRWQGAPGRRRNAGRGRLERPHGRHFSCFRVAGEDGDAPDEFGARGEAHQTTPQSAMRPFAVIFQVLTPGTY